MRDSTKDKRPFPVAAIFFIIYSILFIVHYLNRIDTFDVTKTFEFRFNDIVNEISWIIPILIPFALGMVLLTAKKNNISLPILISFLLLDKLYFFFADIDHYLCARSIIDILNCVFYVFQIAAFTMILLSCILPLASKNKKSRFLNVWYISGILYAIATTAYITTIIITAVRTPYFFDDFIIYRCSDMFFKFLFIPAIFLFGYWLYKENKHVAVLNKDGI